jgi:hypothetical protein
MTYVATRKAGTLGDDLGLHKLLLKGNWPLILSANWDDFFERAAIDLNKDKRTDGRSSGGGASGVVGDAVSGAAASHDFDFPVTCEENNLKVRYRADVERLFGELRDGEKSYGHVPYIFKHHGDFTASKGMDEFVIKYADYRDMVAGQKKTIDVLRYVLSSRSLLFYGYSLSDSDLLSIFDDLAQSFGEAHGPHFWLTADDVAQERMKFLSQHYRIFTIKFHNPVAGSSTPNKWVQLANAMKHVAEESRRSPPSLCLGESTYRVGNCTEVVVKGVSEPELAGRVAAKDRIECGRHGDGGGGGGGGGGGSGGGSGGGGGGGGNIADSVSVIDHLPAAIAVEVFAAHVPVGFDGKEHINTNTEAGLATLRSHDPAATARLQSHDITFTMPALASARGQSDRKPFRTPWRAQLLVESAGAMSPRSTYNVGGVAVPLLSVWLVHTGGGAHTATGSPAMGDESSTIGTSTTSVSTSTMSGRSSTEEGVAQGLRHFLTSACARQSAVQGRGTVVRITLPILGKRGVPQAVSLRLHGASF